MKVRVLRNLGKPYPPFKEGEIVTITDKELLDKLIKEELVENPKEPEEPLESPLLKEQAKATADKVLADAKTAHDARHDKGK